MINIIVHIDNGRIVNPKALKKAFALPDGRYEVKIVKKNKRSLQQNAYYWAIVVPMVKDGLNDLGHDVTLEETHDFLKARFNCHEVVNESTGECICVPRSTTDLNKGDFGVYLEKIMHFSAEFLSITIPAAGSQALINY